MAGIANISKQIDNKKSNSFNNANNKEVFLFDGTTIATSVMSTGEDNNIDNIFRHYVAGAGLNGKGRYIFCRNTVNQPCWVCDSPTLGNKERKPQMLFSFWGFVHNIRLDSKPDMNVDSWVQKTVGKRNVWEMVVNEPRIISLPVGKEEVNWDNFVEIHQMGNGGEGGFDKVINVSRKGKTMTDTVYRLMATGVSVNVDEMPAFDSVENLHTYFLNKADAEDASFKSNSNSSNDDDESGVESYNEDNDDDSSLPF